MLVNCVAHLLPNCAMHELAHFKNIDEVITTIKAATTKNKGRKKDFLDAGLPPPLDPLLTRWATWLRAALQYSENLPSQSVECKPLSQQNKRRYQCGRFSAGLG